MDQRRAKGEETKQKIIEAAIEIVSTQGIKGLSAKKVADNAGISKSNVFHHFKSVDDILLAMIAGLCETMTAALRDHNFTSLEPFLQTMGSSTFSLSDQELAYYRVLFAFYDDAVFHERYKEQLLTIKNEFAKYLKTMILEIEGVEISTELSEMITMDLDGLGLHYLIECDTEKFKKIWDLKVKQYIFTIKST